MHFTSVPSRAEQQEKRKKIDLNICLYFVSIWSNYNFAIAYDDTERRRKKSIDEVVLQVGLLIERDL